MPSGTSQIYIIINYLHSNFARGGKATMLRVAQNSGKATLIGHQLIADGWWISRKLGVLRQFMPGDLRDGALKFF